MIELTIGNRANVTRGFVISRKGGRFEQTQKSGHPNFRK